MNVDVPASSTPVDKMLITVCRNELCASGTPTVTRDPCAEGVIGCPTRVDCVLRGDVKVDCIVSGGSAADADASAPTFVSLDFLALTRADRDVLADGDKYTIRVTSPGAPAPLLDVSRTAVYAKSYPNGVGCDGEDGYCRSATLK